MIKVLVASILCFFSSSLLAQSLEYTVDLTNSTSKRVRVTLLPKKLGTKTVTFQMPAWAPGAYSVTNYGRYVQDLQAYDKAGKKLSVTQIDQNRWSIANARSLHKIEYDVADSRKDSTSLWFAMAHVDSNLVFANGTALFGYVNDRKDVPSRVTYLKPDDWELATALEHADRSNRDCAFTASTFSAKDYDELVDAPILAAQDLQTRCFEQAGALYEVVVVSNKSFPMDSLQEYTKQIVKAQTEFFHETPFKHYTFLIYAPSFMQLPSMGQGALEHMNSSAYLMMYQPWSQFKEQGLRIISHEFFHTWNVKRIHSSLLGPFDYTNGVKTTSLWLSEGITDYYAHSLLARNGIISGEHFLNDVINWYAQYRFSKPALTKSLEQLSIEESNFILENAVTLYTKGPLVGMMLDAEIRTQTNNKRSLDDVMLALNGEAKRGEYFKDPELISKIEKIAGVDLKDLYTRYIAGADSIAIEPMLNKLGLTTSFDLSSELTGSGQGSNVELAFTSKGELVLLKLPLTSFFAQAGFLDGDTVIAINGQPVKGENLKSLLQGIDRESEVSVDIRRGNSMTLKFRPSSLEQNRTRRRTLQIRPATDATPLQIAIRDAIVGKMTD